MLCFGILKTMCPISPPVVNTILLTLQKRLIVSGGRTLRIIEQPIFTRLLFLLIVLASMTARQFFTHCKGPFAPIEVVDPPRVSEHPNNFCECGNGVNTYTDGSLLNPTLSPFVIHDGTTPDDERR